MPDFPTESLSAKASRIQPANLTAVNTPLRLVKRRDAYSSDALVRQEFGLTDIAGFENATINHYGPGTNQAINSLLVPVAGGPNSHAAVELASNIASELAATITLLTVLSEDTTDDQRQAASKRLEKYTASVASSSAETDLVRSDDVVSTIATESDAHELLVIGASEQSLFKRFFSGSIPDKLRQKTHAPIFTVSQ